MSELQRAYTWRKSAKYYQGLAETCRELGAQRPAIYWERMARECLAKAKEIERRVRG